MTHYNLVFRYGHDRFASDLVAAGGWGTILPDLPMEHGSDWMRVAEENGLDNVLLAAPVDKRCTAGRGGGADQGIRLRGVDHGTTGARAGVDDAASALAKRVKAVTDKPAVVGFGISTAETAVTAAKEADGVIVASALMRGILDGSTIEEAAALIAEIRAGLDEAYPPKQ